MAAYFDTGFSVRQTPWHGEGLVLDDYPTDWNDARVKAGLLWEPALQPVYQLDVMTSTCDLCLSPLGTPHTPPLIIDGIENTAGDNCPAWSIDHPFVEPKDVAAQSLVNSIRELPDNRLVVRDDTHAALGIVSDQFALVTHDTMGQILESVLGLPNVKFETAGSCKGGAQVWALAYLDEPFTVAGDDSETYPFVALLNAHDGSGACKLVSTSVRVVCWNTYQAASMQGERSGRQFTFRHVGDVKERIDEAVKALAGVRDDAHEWDELAKELYGISVDDATFNHFMADFIPDPIGDVVSDRVRKNVETARTTFKSLYFDSVTTEAHRGTALGLLDTAVEWSDHVRGYRSRDTYMSRTMLRPEPLKAKALSLVRQHTSSN